MHPLHMTMMTPKAEDRRRLGGTHGTGYRNSGRDSGREPLIRAVAITATMLMAAVLWVGLRQPPGPAVTPAVRSPVAMLGASLPAHDRLKPSTRSSSLEGLHRPRVPSAVNTSQFLRHSPDSRSGGHRAPVSGVAQGGAIGPKYAAHLPYYLLPSRPPPQSGESDASDSKTGTQTAASDAVHKLSGTASPTVRSTIMHANAHHTAIRAAVVVLVRHVDEAKAVVHSMLTTCAWVRQRRVLLLVAVDCDLDKVKDDARRCPPAQVEALDTSRICNYRQSRDQSTAGGSAERSTPEFTKVCRERVRAIDVTVPFWSTVPPAKVRHKVNFTHSALGRWKFGYRAMCAFMAGGILRVAAIARLDFFLRVDDDATFTCDPVNGSYDPFVDMATRGSVYGYYKYTPFDQASGLAMWTARYTRKNPALVGQINPTVRHEYGKLFGLDTDVARENETHLKEVTKLVTKDRINRFLAKVPTYYNNLELVAVRFLFDARVRHFTEAVFRSHGIFYERWGDAPLRFLQVTLFEPNVCGGNGTLVLPLPKPLNYCHNGCLRGPHHQPCSQAVFPPAARVPWLSKKSTWIANVEAGAQDALRTWAKDW